ncbi:hypothetical protein Bca52824_082994 [Brassica carinata]|uniref:Uncharacterized protein n=1 Tax=Brassica carinata TaxID=52824 RepID=A0A8X7PLE1_BRACI|nr:hypothetical protein Bca52824_082994 [Brassica carinata]
MEVLGSPWFVKLGYSSSLVWCVLVNPFTTAAGCGFEYAVGLSTTLVGCRSKGVLVFDFALVLYFVLAVANDSLAAPVSVHWFSVATGVWWFSATWVCLSLLWWCAWQLCAGWSQIMEYGDYSSFCSVRHPVQVAPGLIIARFGC